MSTPEGRSKASPVDKMKFPSPIQILREAIHAVPIVKFALGVAGVAAAVTIIGSFKINLLLAGFATIIMFVLMAVLIVLAGASHAGDFQKALRTFIWFSVILVMAVITATITSVLFNMPLPLQALLQLPQRSSSVPLNSPADPQGFLKALERRDPNMFNGFHPENYRIARVFPNKASLDEGGFATILSNTKTTLDIAVITGHTLLGVDSTAIEQAIKKQGAKIRIVVFDVSPKNQNNCDALARATDRSCDDLRVEYRHVAEILKEMHRNSRNGAGGLEVHVYSNIVPYTMWIRDASDDASKMALMRVHLFRDRANWPSFVIAKDGTELIQNLSKEFEKIWSAATPLDLDGK